MTNDLVLQDKGEEDPGDVLDEENERGRSLFARALHECSLLQLETRLCVSVGLLGFGAWLRGLFEGLAVKTC